MCVLWPKAVYDIAFVGGTVNNGLDNGEIAWYKRVALRENGSATRFLTTK